MSPKLKLVGTKVILRPLRMSDAPRFVRWLADEDVTRLLGRTQPPPTLQQEKSWIREELKKNPMHVFAIDTRSGKHIGSAGLHTCIAGGTAEFGIFIGDKTAWGKGYGTEATKLVLDYAFFKLGAHRVELKVYAPNIGAKKVYQRVGFTHEGTMRQARKVDGAFVDSEVWGILHPEWAKR